MRAIWILARREAGAFFASPMAYVVLTVWLLYHGVTLTLFVSWFSQNLASATQPTVTPLAVFFGGQQNPLFYIALFVVVPVITMRLFAEERRTGTLETLLTAPVGDVAIVVGKFLGALWLWVVLWIPTLLYVVILSYHGSIDWGAIAATYLGIFGLGIYYMAIGLLMSAVAQSQVVAAILTFMMLGVLFLLGLGERVFDEGREVFGYVSVLGHMDDFSRGIVDARYLVYDVSLAILALFLTVLVLDGRRYRT